MKEMKEQKGMYDKDWQPGEKQFAGKMLGTANKYMERQDKIITKEAKKIKSQSYKGRYD